MEKPRSLYQRLIVPVGIGVVGVVLSCAAFWAAAEAEDSRIRSILELRSEWRARDFETKILAAGEAVGSIATTIATGIPLDPDLFDDLAGHARREGSHVNALQWAPRVRREDVADFEQRARALGMSNYRMFDVSAELRRTGLTEREEYFPVLFDARPDEARRTLGLALGRFDGRRIPMELARDTGQPVASMPVRPIGAPSHRLLYLLFWPVYDTIEVPPTPQERRERLRGFVVGNFDIAALLTAAVEGTPKILATIHVAIAPAYAGVPVQPIDAATYLPAVGKIAPGAVPAELAKPAAELIARDFTVFGQNWRLGFRFSPEVVANMRARDSWAWLIGGLLLTAALAGVTLREGSRRDAVAALVMQRSSELLESNKLLFQAQKMEAIGNLTGGVAHDFNNLLAVVIGNLDLLQDRIQERDPEAKALVEAALQAGLRGAELTRQLLAFARRQTLEPELTDINELVGGVTRMLRRLLPEHIEISFTPAPDLWPALIDPAQLETAITNLATNARDAMPEGGRLAIETRNAHLDADYAAENPEVAPGDFVLLQVSDDGAGMAPETLAQAFEPFFTTKPAGEGTGLGLSMVFGFVKQSRGHVKIYSELGEGTVVRIYLPRAAAQDAARAAAPSTPRRGSETILVVEDNADVRRTLVRQLVELGYSVLEAENAGEALRVLRATPERIDLLFTDLVMPGPMNGHELAAQALAERPELKVLFTSGYPGNALRKADRVIEGAHFLGKPYRRQDLADRLRDLLD